MTRVELEQGPRAGAARWVVDALLLALALGLVLVVVAHVWLQIITPSDGARAVPERPGVAAEGVPVAPLAGSSSPLRAGDVVVAVEGVPLEVWARRLFAAQPAAPDRQVGDRLRYEVLRNGDLIMLDVPLGRYPLVAVVRANWGTVLFGLVFAAVALLLVLRRPGLLSVRVLGLGGAALLAATTWSFGLQVGDLLGRAGFWLFHVGSMLGFMLFWTAGLHFALLFPRTLAPARRPWAMALLYGGPYLLLAAYLWVARVGSGSTLEWLASWPPTVGVHASVMLFLTLVAFTRQYATVRNPTERAQVRWVVFAGLITGGAGLLLYLLPPLLGAAAVHSNLIGAVVIVFPIAIAVAVLRHALFDIDRLIGQTLVYGGLTAAVIGVYVLVVDFVGSRLRASDDRALALLATGLVAVGFQPVRARLQRLVDRRMFGERDPVRMIGRLGTRLEATADTERLLPTLVETVADALRLPYVALRLEGHEGEVLAAEYGRALPAALELPLVDGGLVTGWLLVAARESGTELSPEDRRLLEAVAQQAGAAVQRVSLTRDLKRSRRELVRLREEERRRLRRDLHDGVGPSLAAMGLKLDAARNLLPRAPERVQAILASLGEEVQGAVAEVRRVADGLRPPALDELGLVQAVRERARGFEGQGVRIGVDATETLPELPAAVEVAAYFIVLEALTNVIRHARASGCRVSLRVRGTELEVEIEDDGAGPHRGPRPGIGLHSMRERAAEVGGECRIEAAPGGGTRVRALLPLPESSR